MGYVGEPTVEEYDSGLLCDLDIIRYDIVS